MTFLNDTLEQKQLKQIKETCWYFFIFFEPLLRERKHVLLSKILVAFTCHYNDDGLKETRQLVFGSVLGTIRSYHGDTNSVIKLAH